MTGIRHAGRACVVGYIEKRGVRQAVEIQPCVELVRAFEPARAKRDRILNAVKGRFG